MPRHYFALIRKGIVWKIRGKEKLLLISLFMHIINTRKGVLNMAIVNVNFKLDEDVKKSMELACSELGLSMSAAFTVFARKVGREKRIPFEIAVDPFYTEENLARLKKAINDLNAGKGTVHEVDYE
jgi:DNA-damage-inducible protein J